MDFAFERDLCDNILLVTVVFCLSPEAWKHLALNSRAGLLFYSSSALQHRSMYIRVDILNYYQVICNASKLMHSLNRNYIFSSNPRWSDKWSLSRHTTSN